MALKLDEAVQKDLTAEVEEWIEAFDAVVAHDWEQGAAVLSALRTRAREAGVPATGDVTTPYLNTIPKHDEVPYPGDRALERRNDLSGGALGTITCVSSTALQPNLFAQNSAASSATCSKHGS